MYGTMPANPMSDLYSLLLVWIHIKRVVAFMLVLTGRNQSRMAASYILLCEPETKKMGK